MNPALRWALRIALGLFLLLIVAVSGLVGWLHFAFPAVGPAGSEKAEPTPERIARGAYLANHVTLCLDCHGERLWDYYSGPMAEGSEGRGGEVFDRQFGFPGRFVSANITPANLKDWTDGEIARTIRTGVKRDGTPMFPVMPYTVYRHLCDEDTMAIVAFLRTLKPLPGQSPAAEYDFPMNLIVRTIPAPPDAWACPDENTDDVTRGKYLAHVGGCVECHTPRVKGQKIPGMDFAGGWEFPMPKGGFARAANITPDVETGIGSWTREVFIARFKAHASEEARRQPVDATGRNTPMPWTMYAGMTEKDLGAIFAYLSTLKPVRNAVEKWSPPTPTAAGK